MNIFILDRDINKCARYHCDKHVVKMILESVQLLCTALNNKGFKTPYKSTHMKHPCVLWVEESYDNFLWLVKLTRALNEEYKYRYKKEDDHKSMAALEQIVEYTFESKGLTEFPQAMPDEFKVPDDAVAAYRNFYLGEKMSFANWTRRKPPKWLNS